jgi:hypothetical protein
MMAETVTRPSGSSYRSVLSDLLLFLKSVFNEVILIELLEELINDMFYLLSVKSCLRLF